MTASPETTRAWLSDVAGDLPCTVAYREFSEAEIDEMLRANAPTDWPEAPERYPAEDALACAGGIVSGIVASAALAVMCVMAWAFACAAWQGLEALL